MMSVVKLLERWLLIFVAVTVGADGVSDVSLNGVVPILHSGAVVFMMVGGFVLLIVTIVQDRQET